MKRLTDRRSLLLSAGSTAAAAMVAASVAAQSPGIHGTVAFEGGAAIPKGQIRIAITGAAASDAARSPAGTEARLDSNGKATAIAFQIPLPAARAASPAPAEIEARLEREDGWLLARGSASFTPGEAVAITLYTVMY